MDNVKQQVMWVPAVVTGICLAVGLAGVCWTGDWRLLLVVPPSFVLTDLLDGFGFERMLAQQPIGVEHPRFPYGFELFARTIVLVTALVLPMVLMDRYASPPLQWNWYRIFLFMGVAVMPWGYVVRSVENRFTRHLMFSFTLASGCALFCPLACAKVFLVVLQLALLVVFPMTSLWLKQRRDAV